MAQILEIKRLPSYNKHMPDNFMLKEKDKFIILKDEGVYYKAKNVRLKKTITLLKAYFKDEAIKEVVKPIQYDN